LGNLPVVEEREGVEVREAEEMRGNQKTISEA
jgi:hypothetical protein